MDWRKEQQQSIGQGYQHQANSASYQQETVDTITCIVTATASDMKAFENLTETKKVLTMELATSNEKRVTALLKITKLTE